MKLVLIIFKLGVGAFLGILLIEASLHAISTSPAGKVFPVVEPLLGQPDKDIGFALKPNKKALWNKENRAFISINAQGLRDKAITAEKPKNTFRVALSGDSIVEAAQVENAYVFDNLAEKKFQEQGKNIEVMNLGMAGNGPLRQLVRLEKFALPLQPDLTIMLMYASDFLSGELRDDSQNPGYKITKNGTVERSYGFRNNFSQRHADTLLGKTFLLLMHHSHIFRMIYKKKDEPFYQILGLNISRQKKESMKTDKCRTNEIQALFNFWVESPPSPDWIVTQHYFKEIGKYSVTNTPVILGLYIPITQKECIEQNRKRQEVISSIKKLTKKEHITFIDWNKEVTQHLKEGQSIESLHGFGASLGRGHLNYNGHAVYAAVLQDIISKQIR
jgi:hypothetical protein